MKQKQVWIIVIILILVALIWWIFFSGNQVTAPEVPNGMNDELPTDDPNQEIPEGSATNQPSGNNAVVVLDQPASDFVTIDNYVLSGAGFVVIHEANTNGSLGKIVGQSGLLAAGRGQDLELNIKLVSGKKYVAQLYLDNGDKKFNPSTDTAIPNNGSTISANFLAQ